MKKRWLAVLLALLMVMGTVGMAAAAVEEDEETEVKTAEELMEKQERQGPPEHIKDMLKQKEEDGIVRDEQGPPEFVRDMLKAKIHIMDKSKLMIHGNPFVSDLPPVIKEGRTLIPVGAVVKGLGAKSVEWDEEFRTVTIIKYNEETEEEETKIVLTVDELTYTVYKNGSDEGETFEMDTKAQILGNRTFVPLKYIAEALGEKVEWNPEDKSINIGRKFGQARAEEAKMNDDDEDDDEDDEEEDEEEE